METNICIWVHHRGGVIEDVTFGLAAQADAIISARGGKCTITADALAQDFEESLYELGRYGVNRVVHFKGSAAEPYHGEYKNERFEIIHELAAAIGGSVAGTRPVVDWQTLAYERQIGQSGMAVTPRLIINCGISCANEYTAGMEKSRNVVAINIDPRARIFRFADLGVVGDFHQVLPQLVKRLQEIKAAETKT